MLLSDSEISMIPLCLNLLLTPVDYIYVICLKKCLSWLVWVQSKACSSNCICIIIPLLYLCSEGAIYFLAVTWALGLNNWLKSWGCWYKNEKNNHWMQAYHVVGTSKSFKMHACPYHGSVWELICLKKQWDPGVGYLRGWEGSWESCY